MDPVSKLNQIIAVLRSRASPQPARAAGHNRAEKNRAAPAGKSTLAQLRTSVGKRVRAIDPDDPQRSRKAVRVFLESVLLNELGPDLMNDPKFYDLVADVQETMEADASLKDELERLVHQLLDETAPPSKG